VLIRKTSERTEEKEISEMAGTEERTEGTWDKAKGKAKEGIGDATDNEDLEAEGKKDQAKGGMKKAWGDTKDAAHNASEAVKDAVDR
jgi:uncharacterized protein YjbJ (UPF0337 family)